MSKAHTAKARSRPGKRDLHHILFQRLHWTEPWAKRLREHRYMRIRVPRDTLHDYIHDKLHDVPVPNEDICEATYLELERLKELGVIDIYHDSFEERLDFLIGFWKQYDNMSFTLEAVRFQARLLKKYRNGKIS